VASARHLADSFNAAGITAAEVDGATPKEERNRLIKQYREGKITVLTNAELFTEGLDLPNVDCVIMMRPTQSLSLFLQFSMRAMNPREGKTAIIIDHVDNLSRFGLPTDERNWQMAGEGKKKKTVAIFRPQRPARIALQVSTARAERPVRFADTLWPRKTTTTDRSTLMWT
jgi:superfamily II DNA or RNA helicase